MNGVLRVKHVSPHMGLLHWDTYKCRFNSTSQSFQPIIDFLKADIEDSEIPAFEKMFETGSFVSGAVIPAADGGRKSRKMREINGA